MDSYQKIIIALAIIAIASLMYKIYQQSRLDNPERKGSLTILFIHYYSIRYIFPISKKEYKESDFEIIKNANRALSLFWISFCLALLIGLLKQVL